MSDLSGDSNALVQSPFNLFLPVNFSTKCLNTRGLLVQEEVILPTNEYGKTPPITHGEGGVERGCGKREGVSL